jgi:hypothetical protein
MKPMQPKGRWSIAIGAALAQFPLAAMAVVLWGVEDVCRWVRGLPLPEYEPVFRQHAVNGARLAVMDDQGLDRELGIADMSTNPR